MSAGWPPWHVWLAIVVAAVSIGGLVLVLSAAFIDDE